MKQRVEHVNIGNDNSGHIRDINVNNVNKTINIYKQVLKSRKEKELDLQGSQRPYLKNKFEKQEKVQCIGFCIRKYDDGSMYTLLNVHDLKGRYVADHIQVNLSDIDTNPLYFILEISGDVEQYDHKMHKCKEYSVRAEYCERYEGGFYRIKNVDYDKNNIDGVSGLLKTLSSNQLLELKHLLIDEINRLVPNLWRNHIQDYIHDLYFFGNFKINITNGGIPENQLTDIINVDLICIFAATIYYLSEFLVYTTYEIYLMITQIVNTQQSIKCYKRITSPGNNFKEFMETRFYKQFKYGHLTNPDSYINAIWEKVKIRKKNFGCQNIYLDETELISEAFKVIVAALPYVHKYTN